MKHIVLDPPDIKSSMDDNRDVVVSTQGIADCLRSVCIGCLKEASNLTDGAMQTLASDMVKSLITNASDESVCEFVSDAIKHHIAKGIAEAINEQANVAGVESN